MSDYLVRVHRFNDTVAVTPPFGPTFYIGSADALQFARALKDAAIDVDMLSFSQSAFSAREVGTC